MANTFAFTDGWLSDAASASSLYLSSKLGLTARVSRQVEGDFAEKVGDTVYVRVQTPMSEAGEYTVGTVTSSDIVETKVIKDIFGEDANKIPISSTKSLIGHSIGAAGAMELVGTILTMRNSLITPTINLNDPDPECDLDYVPNEARECDVEIALKNSFGFGGQNAVLILKRDV